MEFDNELTIALKKARDLKIPRRYILKDENLVSKISELAYTGLSLELIFSQFSFLPPTDVAMIYARISPNLNEINTFYEQLDISPIKDDFELKLLISEWEKQYGLEYEADMEKLERIEILQEELFQYEPLPFSELKIDSTTVEAKMEPVETGFAIFDSAQPDVYIPYILWNSPQGKLIKVYTGKNLEERPDYNKIVPSLGAKESNEDFAFSVWSGDVEKDNIKEATKESYIKATYNLSQNRLKIRIPLEDGTEKDKTFDKIYKVFSLKPEEVKDTLISGEFYIYDVEIWDLVLSFIVANHELVNTYLFMKEMSNSFMLKKKKVNLYYRDISESVSFSLTQNYAKGGEIVEVNGQKNKLAPGTPYLKVKISSANSLEVAKSFMKILSRLLSYYKNVEEEVINLYETYIPNLRDERKEITILKGVSDNKISRLKQVAPDLFVTDYARKCLCQFQPIPISKDEVKTWENKTFIYKGKRRKRQVLAFPPNNPIWNFVCPDDAYPFPGVKKNNLENKDKYAGLPCCFVNDQMTEGVRSKYNKLYGDLEEEEEEEVKVEHMMKTDKILPPGRYGLLPSNIVDLLRTWKFNKNKEIKRKGVPRSPNSLLHCISIAVNDSRYLDLSEEEREDYVSRMRQHIAKNVYPGLMKQEMYDFLDSEILNSLKDEKVFLDPYLYYRAIEEIYNINIFMFAPSEDEEKRLKTKQDANGILLLPRYKIFHSQTPRPDRQNVLIYRTLGSESDNLLYPQCEIIVSQTEKEDISYFGKELHDILFDTMKAIRQVITWELISEKEKIDILARDNIYSQISYFKIIDKKARKQFIDEYGKCRGFYLPYNNEEVLLVIPPSQPENLKTSTEIKRTSHLNVLSLLGTPIAVSKKMGKFDGFWYPVLDLVYGIYVPIYPVDSLDMKYPLGAPNPLGNEGGEVVPRIRKIKRDLDFILQVLLWLLALSKEDIGIFMEKYIVLGEIKGDSSKIYDFTNIGRTFPIVSGIEEGILKMKERIPTLFEGDKIFLYSLKFQEGLNYLLKKHIKEYPLEIPREILRKNFTEQDFKYYPGVALFLGEKDFSTWINSFERSYSILTNIQETFYGKIEPFIYLSPDKHIYLIQNTGKGGLDNALFLGDLWEKNKINYGYLAPEIEKEVKYVVYGISTANTLIPIENRAGESIDFYSVVKYNENTYGAMLRLL